MTEAAVEGGTRRASSPSAADSGTDGAFLTRCH